MLVQGQILGVLPPYFCRDKVPDCVWVPLHTAGFLLKKRLCPFPHENFWICMPVKMLNPNGVAINTNLTEKMNKKLGRGETN